MELPTFDEVWDYAEPIVRSCSFEKGIHLDSLFSELSYAVVWAHERLPEDVRDWKLFVRTVIFKFRRNFLLRKYNERKHRKEVLVPNVEKLGITQCAINRRDTTEHLLVLLEKYADMYGTDRLSPLHKRILELSKRGYSVLNIAHAIPSLHGRRLSVKSIVLIAIRFLLWPVALEKFQQKARKVFVSKTWKSRLELLSELLDECYDELKFLTHGKTWNALLRIRASGKGIFSPSFRALLPAKVQVFMGNTAGDGKIKHPAAVRIYAPHPHPFARTVEKYRMPVQDRHKLPSYSQEEYEEKVRENHLTNREVGV